MAGIVSLAGYKNRHMELYFGGSTGRCQKTNSCGVEAHQVIVQGRTCQRIELEAQVRLSSLDCTELGLLYMLTKGLKNQYMICACLDSRKAAASVSE